MWQSDGDFGTRDDKCPTHTRLNLDIFLKLFRVILTFRTMIVSSELFDKRQDSPPMICGGPLCLGGTFRDNRYRYLLEWRIPWVIHWESLSLYLLNQIVLEQDMWTWCPQQSIKTIHSYHSDQHTSQERGTHLEVSLKNQHKRTESRWIVLAHI